MGASSGRPPRHLGHGRQQRQTATLVGHRLVGDGHRPRVDQQLGLHRIRRQVQIGKEQLTGAQQFTLLRLGLLHLHYHLGPGEYLSRTRHQFSTGSLVLGIGQPDRLASLLLHQYLVSPGRQLLHSGGSHADPVFMVFDFLGYANNHARSPAVIPPAALSLPGRMPKNCNNHCIMVAESTSPSSEERLL